MKFIMRTWPRLLLYAFLVLIIVCSIVFWSISERSSLSENFLAGSIDIAITVVLIDGLLSLDRVRRIKALNAGHANASTYQLGLIIVSFMKEFKFPIKPNELEVVGMTNEELRKKVSEFLASDQYSQFLRNVKNAKKGTLKELEKIEKLTTKSANSVIESLENAKPYPDPTLIKFVNDTVPSVIAITKVVETMYEGLEIVRKAGTANDAALAKSILDEEMDRLTTKQRKADARINIQMAFSAFLNAMLTVHERAEKNSLHYNV